MRISRSKSVAWIIAIVLMASLLFLPYHPAKAAAKEKIYVVSAMKLNDGMTTLTNNKTNKKGFIKTIKSPIDIQTFTYGKKFRLKKYVSQVISGDFKGTDTWTYTWKKGLLKKKTGKSADGTETQTYTYNKKKQIKSSANTWSNSEGTNVSQSSYKYKKGHVAKETAKGTGWTNVITYKFDKRKNVTSVSAISNGRQVSYYKAAITYKKKGPSIIKTRRKNPMMDKEENLTISFTYKKIKVKKSYVKAIKEQQWKLINNAGCCSFAW